MSEHIIDLHVHSKYSRAVSQKMDLENMQLWAKKKGIGVISTSDFTHPAWFAELKKKLTQNDRGLFSLKEGADPAVSFFLTTEISCIYSQGGRVRRIHIVVVAPTLEIVEKINGKLNAIGNLKADGRPILGLNAKELAKIVLGVSQECLIIPAHAWTPWFSLFGSESGFDSINECFGDLSPQIYALETGLSSDPAMNWRLSQVDRLNIVSSSDAHSPANLGREATVLELNELTHTNIVEAIKTHGKRNHIAYTIEFFPEEGKYHWDGHRNCKKRMAPKETIKLRGICPVCKKPLTVGVMHRVEKLADREEGYTSKNRPPFKSLVPLEEIIGEAFGQKKGTKKVLAEYERIVQVKNEFDVLLHVPLEELQTFCDPMVVEGIKRVRAKKLTILPGYDGVYGTVKVFSEKERTNKKQESLF